MAHRTIPKVLLVSILAALNGCGPTELPPPYEGYDAAAIQREDDRAAAAEIAGEARRKAEDADPVVACQHQAQAYDDYFQAYEDVATGTFNSFGLPGAIFAFTRCLNARGLVK